MELPPNWDNHAAGPIGAALALLWTKASWRRSIALLAGGSVAAYYGSPYAANALGMPEGLTGLVLGLVSMSVAGKLFETWERIDLVQWATDLRRKWLGV
jgi:hypothetical protein